MVKGQQVIDQINGSHLVPMSVFLPGSNRIGTLLIYSQDHGKYLLWNNKDALDGVFVWGTTLGGQRLEGRVTHWAQLI